MESRGNAHLTDPAGINVGVEQAANTIHYGPFIDIRNYQGFTTNTKPDEGFDKDFHLYQLEWTPDRFVFKIDNKVTGEIVPPAGGFWEMGGYPGYPGIKNPWKGREKMAPFDQEFYFILNLAVGGVDGYFGDHLTNKGAQKPWKNGSPVAAKDFWQGKNGWLPTWDLDKSDDASLQVDYIKVWAL
jgi:hypothetical protein